MFSVLQTHPCPSLSAVSYKKKHEMWTVFGGHPLRFSLAEFASVTGLPCGDFSEDYDPDYEPKIPKEADDYWLQKIGKTRLSSLCDISLCLPKSSGDIQLRIALLLIIDGVLIASLQNARPTYKYVQMLEDVDSFLKFPWGRESFHKTIKSLIPPRTVGSNLETDLAAFRGHLQRRSFRLRGFPLALQLLAYRNIPALALALTDPLDDTVILDWDNAWIPRQSRLLADVHAVEQAPDV